MRDAILNFPEQFAFQPVIGNANALERRTTVIVSGMGGSHLAADLLGAWKPTLDLVVHSDYGLPPVLGEDRLKNSFLIASSYSGNTEETVNAYDSAKKRGIPVAVIATGGTLLERAITDGVAFVRLPSTGIQPRSALGLSIKAMLVLLDDHEGFDAVSCMSSLLRPQESEGAGSEIARRIQGRAPLIYSSSRNRAVASIWKIKFNETGKIPAFYNVIPEANHNEMTGFDLTGSVRELSGRFYAIFLRDSEDDQRVQKRMDIMRDIYQSKGIAGENIVLAGHDRFERMFSSIILADWAAFSTAESNGADPDGVPLVEEFKRRMAA